MLEGTNGVLECWSIGVLEYWSTGVTKSRSDAVADPTCGRLSRNDDGHRQYHAACPSLVSA